MRFSRLITFCLGLWCLAAAQAGAMTFQYTDGTKLEGDIVRATAKFLQVRTSDNQYVEVDWGKLSQDTLQELKTYAEEKPDKRLLENVEPYIEIPEEEIIKRTEVVIKPVPRLERPEKGSLLSAMFHSSLGIVCLLLLYAANIYAGYEVSIIRAYPKALVCGIAAVAPVIGPIVFLCLPTKMESVRDEEEELTEEGAAAAGHSASYSVPGVAAPGATAAATGLPSASHEDSAGHGPAAAALPQSQVFKRGQFTFNRRFIETKFKSFFGTIRRGNDKDMVLMVKSMRGEYVANRITRVAASDVHFEVMKGSASQEIQIPYGEIQEIHLKHKDA